MLPGACIASSVACKLLATSASGLVSVSPRVLLCAAVHDNLRPGQQLAQLLPWGCASLWRCTQLVVEGCISLVKAQLTEAIIIHWPVQASKQMGFSSRSDVT